MYPGYARASFYNLSRLGVNTVAWLIIVPILLRALGEESFGLWTIIMSAKSLSMVLELGMGASATKFVSEFRAAGQPERAAQALSIAIIVQILIGVLFGTTLYFVAPSLPELFNFSQGNSGLVVTAFRIAGVGLLFDLLRSTTVAVPIAAMRFDIYNALAISYTIVHAILVVVATLATKSVLIVIGFSVFAGVILALIGLYGIRWSYPAFAFCWVRDVRIWQRVIRFSLSTSVANVAGVTFAYGDRLLVAGVLGPVEAGYYGIAAGIAAKLNQAGAAVAHLTLPLVSSLKGEGKSRQELAELISRVSEAYYIIVFALGSTLYIVAAPFLEVWLNERLESDVVSMQLWLVVCYTLFSLNAVGYFALLALELPKYVALFQTLGTGTTLILIYVLGRSQGLAGAAVANLGYSLTLGFNLSLLHRLRLPLTSLVRQSIVPLAAFVFLVVVHSILYPLSTTELTLLLVGSASLYTAVLWRKTEFLESLRARFLT